MASDQITAGLDRPMSGPSDADPEMRHWSSDTWTDGYQRGWRDAVEMQGNGAAVRSTSDRDPASSGGSLDKGEGDHEAVVWSVLEALRVAADRWDTIPEDCKPLIRRDYFAPRADMLVDPEKHPER